MQDADNLAWKLAAVLAGRATERLLETYDEERGPAADENIRNSTRATDFIAPKNSAMRLFREAALDLAEDHSFARTFVNSGRLAQPYAYRGSSLGTPDADSWRCGPAPGDSPVDVPVRIDGRSGWLLDLLDDGPTLMGSSDLSGALAGRLARTLAEGRDFHDVHGLVRDRYALAAGDAYLFRPDGHVAARFRAANPATVAAALDRLGGGRR